jgi:hypothetical protein
LQFLITERKEIKKVKTREIKKPRTFERRKTATQLAFKGVPISTKLTSQLVGFEIGR